MEPTRPTKHNDNESFTDKSTHSDHSSIRKAHSSNKVDEIHAYQKQTGPFIKSAAEKKLVRKINFTLLPFIGAIMFFQMVDKFTLNHSAVLGLIEDAHLTGTQYSWLGSIFYLGYVCFLPPSSYMIQKFRLSKFMGSLLILWGITTGCTALCNTFAQLAAARTLLGFFEAGILPCILIIINAIYRRSEQPAVYAFTYAYPGVANMVGAVCAYGISFMDDARGIQNWRWLYIIWGSLTILTGVATFFFMPDNAHSFMFRLTEDEKQIVEERIKDNAVVRVREVKTYQIWEALKEVRLWLLFLCGFIGWMETGVIVVFGTLIVKNLGFSGPESILFQTAAGGGHVLFLFMTFCIVYKSGQLYFTAIVATIITLVGCVLLAVLPNTSVKLVGFLLSTAGATISIAITAIVGANVVGYTKKVFYNTVFVASNTLGNFVGPLIMLEREAPFYKTGMTIICVGLGVAFVMLFVIRQMMARENKIRLQNPPEKEVNINDDLTDRENKAFIYKL